MTSPSMKHKITKARANAASELPKARLCAKVIFAALEGGDAMQKAVAELKQGADNNWSHTLAFQFMSGMRGKFAVDCTANEEWEQLHFAHLMAIQVCEQEKLGMAISPSGLNFAALKALAVSIKAGSK